MSIVFRESIFVSTQFWNKNFEKKVKKNSLNFTFKNTENSAINIILLWWSVVLVFLLNWNKWISMFHSKVIKLWVVLTGICLRTFNGHAYYVNCCCLTSNNKFMVTGSSDGTLRLWNLKTGLCKIIFQGISKFKKISFS